MISGRRSLAPQFPKYQLQMIRNSSHAGSWYSNSPSQLSAQICQLIEAQIAISNLEAVIVPHAGYAYSATTAAKAFKNLDASRIKTVFILGPSHHVYLKGCALSACSEYATPLGNLKIDTDIISKLHLNGSFISMSTSMDEDEHSIEMQLPFLKHSVPVGTFI